jgi:hypothetical protein
VSLRNRGATLFHDPQLQMLSNSRVAFFLEIIDDRLGASERNCDETRFGSEAEA